MIAVRKGLRWVLPGILGAFVASGTPAADPDPHEIYQSASEQLQSGNLRAAEIGAARLRDLITRRPEWDPDGVFARELLPSMEARLLRLRHTARELEEFIEDASRDTKPPEISDDQDAVRAYGDWATSTIDRLRRERDGLIAAGLPAPEDQAILARTESYARSQQLLETDVLRRMADAVNHEVEILMPEDERWQMVHARIEQIKKGMMESVLERDRLRRQLANLRARTRAYQEALTGLVLEGAGPTPRVSEPPAGDLSSIFSSHLDRELDTLRSEPVQSRVEYLTRRNSLERYRRYNRVLADAGLIQDQRERITALAGALEKTPIEGGGWVFASVPGWVYGWLLGIFAAATVGFWWVAARRLRRLAAARALPGHSASGRVTGFPRGKDDTHAA